MRQPDCVLVFPFFAPWGMSIVPQKTFHATLRLLSFCSLTLEEQFICATCPEYADFGCDLILWRKETFCTLSYPLLLDLFQICRTSCSILSHYCALVELLFNRICSLVLVAYVCGTVPLAQYFWILSPFKPADSNNCMTHDFIAICLTTEPRYLVIMFLDLACGSLNGKTYTQSLIR